MKQKLLALTLITCRAPVFISGCGNTEVDADLIQETEKAKVTNRILPADARKRYDLLLSKSEDRRSGRIKAVCVRNGKIKKGHNHSHRLQ